MSKLHSDLLPRKVRNKPCLALHNDGSKCKNPALAETTFLGDGELVRPACGWVRVTLCKDHMESWDRKKIINGYYP